MLPTMNLLAITFGSTINPTTARPFAHLWELSAVYFFGTAPTGPVAEDGTDGSARIWIDRQNMVAVRNGWRSIARANGLYAGFGPTADAIRGDLTGITVLVADLRPEMVA
jgi:hypothetical protein